VAGLALSAVLGTLISAVAFGQVQSFRFDITNPDMSAALREFARVSGEQIIYTRAVVADAVASPIAGNYTAESALSQLLAGTDLAAVRSPSGAVMIVRRARAPRGHRGQSEPADPARLADADGEGRPQRGGSSELETVIVSASRIRADGYEAPTPVIVLDLGVIQREAKVDMGDAIRALPVFGPSSSPSNSQQQSFITSGITGLNLISLRNLGFNRNLVLFDGQRVVASSIQGGVDMNTLPSTLVDRIEVVTGGASASWGSDAVTGVVNVILDKDFTGFEAHAELSDNFASKHAQRKYELTYGTDFSEGRGHVVLSGAQTESPDEYYSYDIPGHRYQALVNNPEYAPGNGEPRLIHAEHVGLARATPGGLITSGPLAGTYFVGSEARPERFDSGNVSSGYYSNGGTPNTSEGDIGLVSLPTQGYTFLGLGRYELTENVTASLHINRGSFRSRSNSWSYIRYGDVRISADNPYIPVETQQAMADLGITEFTLGTMNRPATRPGLREQAASLGVPVIRSVRDLYRAVFALDGRINDDWSWNAYYQYGKSELDIHGLNNVQPVRYNLAVDAVRVTEANVGTSGLPIGTVACRSTLRDPGNGCVPLNVFGEGNASQEAIAYVNGAARNGGHTLYGRLEQTVAAFSMNATLPIGLAAGRVSTAFGAEYRKEEGLQDASPAAQASTFQLGNFKDFYGKYDTKELFLEVNVPVIENRGVRTLRLDAAGRLTDYSTSGEVETFKFGVVSQVSDSLRARASYSFDIRAPQLFDLFNAGLPVTSNAIDPNTHLPVAVFTTSRGNPALKPEESTTLALGIVSTPSWAKGLSLSLDYYDINIEGAFASFNVATTLAQCAAGVQMLCGNLVFDGPGGSLSEVFNQPLNADTLRTSGLDLAIDYRTFVGAGLLGVRLIANYQLDQAITQLGRRFDYVGSIGRDSPYDGAPRFNSTVAATYASAGWSVTAQARINGRARIDNEWGPLDIDDNDVPATYYLDLRSSYDFGNGIGAYVALDNVLNKNPPPVPFSVSGASAAETPYVDSLYDAFGRTWRAGIRAKF